MMISRLPVLSGWYMTVMPVALVDIVGVKQIAKLYGLTMTANGVSALFIVPLCGQYFSIAAHTNE